MKPTREELLRYGTYAVIAIAVIGPFLSSNLYLLNILSLMLIFVIFASAWNLLAYS